MDKDLSSCSKRNIHKRTEKEIEDIIKNWEPTPHSQTILDVRSLLQSAAITEVSFHFLIVILKFPLRSMIKLVTVLDLRPSFYSIFVL